MLIIYNIQVEFNASSNNRMVNLHNKTFKMPYSEYFTLLFMARKRNKTPR